MVYEEAGVYRRHLKTLTPSGSESGSGKNAVARTPQLRYFVWNSRRTVFDSRSARATFVGEETGFLSYFRVAFLLANSTFLRARFLIQIGVPTNPKALRIWFSRKRSKE